LNTIIILCLIGLISLILEISGARKLLLPVVFIGLALAFASVVMDWSTSRTYFNDMILFDNYALAFTGLIIAISFIWFIISPGFFHEPSNETDHSSLIIFSIVGAVLMTSFSNLIMLFLGLEILSISMYILAGSNKKSLASNEAALKYFLMGSFATCFLLFGIALIYGQTGSFNLVGIGKVLSGDTINHSMVYTGVFMILVAMAFKISAVPFHFWAPDVYQGSPTVVTAFMSTVVKTAAFAAFLRLFIVSFADIQTLWSTTLWIISAATILVGNILAVYQTDFKRMLAYSSISHAGYMIIAILAMNEFSAGSLLFYTIAYSVSSITSFAVLLVINRDIGNNSIESFYGLGKKNPLLAFVVVVAMLSLAGIPPSAGFFAKYFIFSAAIKSNLTGLVLVAITGSLIGVFYYFRIIIALFKESESKSLELTTGYKTVLVLTTVAAIVLGVLPGLIAGLL
jgi:NADH-quinone oxidoreductase subunit N